MDLLYSSLQTIWKTRKLTVSLNEMKEVVEIDDVTHSLNNSLHYRSKSEKLAAGNRVNFLLRSP